MVEVGFTTGALYLTDIKFEDRIDLFYSAGANAIELSFTRPIQLMDFTLNQETIKQISKFDYISIHAPWKEIRYGSCENSNQVLGKLEDLTQKLDISGIVIHPDIVDDFKSLENSGLPFLIENMDGRKKFGINLRDFEELKNNFNFGFVLDVQHAYEHDSSMEWARELASVFGNRLKHMHISGGNFGPDSYHTPVFLSENRISVEEFLKISMNVPRILEGVVNDNIPETLSREIEFIKSFN